MPKIVIGEKDYKPEQKSTKSHNLKHAGGAPTSPAQNLAWPMKKVPSPNRSKPGD